MNENAIALAEQQKHWLDVLRADAEDIACTMADQVWDRFEIDIEEATEQGVDADFAASIGMSLSSLLALAYDDSFEHHIIGRCEQFSRQAGPQAYDEGRIDLTGLRKGLKLRRHAEVMIEQAIESAKPGVGQMLGIVIGGLFRDPLQEMDAVEKDMQKYARALRRELLKLREPMRALVAEESLAGIVAIRVELGRVWTSPSQ